MSRMSRAAALLRQRCPRCRDGRVFALVERLRPEWGEIAVSSAALALALPLVPPIFRYARLIWMHFDWTADPR